jgi:hypothetical protein
MDTFQKSVLTVALFVLIVGLIFVGSSMKTTPGQDKLSTAACPDFWYSSYFKPCVLSEFGCCADGVTSKTSEDDACISCNETQFKCCPDGITAKTSADDACTAASGPPKCWNVRRLGTNTDNCSSIQDYDVTFAASEGKSSMCKKQEWATACHLAWDGVTNVKSDC